MKFHPWLKLNIFKYLSKILLYKFIEFFHHKTILRYVLMFIDNLLGNIN